MFLPPSVAGCAVVYRSAVTEDEEQRLWEELHMIMAKDGQVAYVTGSVDARRVRNTAADLFGWDAFTELNDYATMSARRVPGLPFSPALATFARGTGSWALSRALASTPDATSTPVVPDGARLVEHQLPGYELHMESPTIGAAWVYLSLLSGTVVHFDCEASGEQGCVHVPARALLCVKGALRWGWRFGERFLDGSPDAAHEIPPAVPGGRPRRVRPADYRFSVQLYKAAPGMVDRGRLTAVAEKSLATAAALPGASESVRRAAEDPAAAAAERDAASAGRGLLGGDYIAPKKTAPGALPSTAARTGNVALDVAAETDKGKQVRRDMNTFAQTLTELQERQNRGEPVDEAWIKQRFNKIDLPEGATDENGFSPSDPMGTWDLIGERARDHQRRIAAMRYEGLERPSGSIRKDAKDGAAASDAATESLLPRSATSGTNPQNSKAQLEAIGHYAAKIGYTRTFDAGKVAQAMKHLESRGHTPPPLPSVDALPDFSSDLEIEVPTALAVPSSSSSRR